MRSLEEYISAGGKRLRLGYTTGTCAAAATRAAVELLLSGEVAASVSVHTPAGIDVLIDVEDACSGSGWASCTVRKDAGDDPDVTDGVLVTARVSRADKPGCLIEGGRGIGRVTRAGLDQPVGAAAINSVPRQMIAEAARAASEEHGYDGGLAVEISIPEGVEIARRTFNPRLGIEGGISVLGTSGIVRPMSEEALIASIRLELKVLRATGATDVLVVPGNYGRDFASDVLGLSTDKSVTCSNYLGETIDEASLLGFETMLVVGHVGKLVKVAAGVMNTHSRVADCRVEVLAAHAALAGATQPVVRQVMGAATTDGVVDILKEDGLLESTMATLMERMGMHLAHRGGDKLRVEAVMFSNTHGLLGETAGAKELFTRHRGRGVEDA